MWFYGALLVLWAVPAIDRWFNLLETPFFIIVRWICTFGRVATSCFLAVISLIHCQSGSPRLSLKLLIGGAPMSIASLWLRLRGLLAIGKSFISLMSQTYCIWALTVRIGVRSVSLE